ncbi:MAG: hypothetical protein R2800_03920 [Flavipsychrobacter sp.]
MININPVLITQLTTAMWEEKLNFYDKLIATNKKFERKGKTMPYTSANGYMFSLFNKAGEIGIRLHKDDCKKFMEEHNTTIYKSYGAVMKDYVLIPEEMYGDLKLLAKYLDKSYEYVMSLPPKKEKK